jgi:DNA polymerase elongation subunit (family B)
MHIRKLEAVGWISIKTEKLNGFEYIPTCCDLNYKTAWTNIEKVDDRLIEKFVIAAFDIECKSEDGSFPQPQRDGDKVIQIGVTLSRFGESECFYKHILCLKKTSNLEGITVEWFNTEEELLLGFTKLIRKLNPDIITGYNIFGFDFSYLMERSKKLEIAHKFARLSRVNNEMSEWVEAGLSSAALGTNILKYYKMTGRVIIDLMKVVQRDYKLSSYKLDSVASYFIREKVDKIETNESDGVFKIKTKNTFGLYLDQYVVLVYIEGAVENKYRDGHKYKILELGDDYIVAKGTVDPNEFIGKGYKTFWCQAKDDITPNDIFRMCDGTPDERAVIAKYCVMDCVLCNKLVAKLQVITNNVSMANVCNVPLSYLFLRGQGVKIFSLVSKKCREKNHVIPLIQKKEKKIEKQKIEDLKKNADEEVKDGKLERLVNHLNNKDNNQEEDSDDDDIGYEGAIVFIPEAGVYYEPIIVLDYASLYPNAMILRNLSHECFVDDPEYDNLSGYKYHTISYKNNDGTSSTCRFAEKLDGTKGIIPEILTDLLSARKKYKKLMEEEKDPFKRSILDSLQLAYKITANSLYGQTGASTSPVCMKEIAASTTATGREMLLFSKYFVENYFADLIKFALSDKDKYMETIEKLYEYYPTDFVVNDVAMDEKTKVKTKITHEIHVCSDKNSKIPDSKFVQREIGYELECELYNDYKKTSKFYDSYMDILVKMGYDTSELFNEKFVKTLKLSTVTKRREFYDDLAEIVLEKKKKKNAFYKKHKDLLETMGFNEEDYENKFHKRLTKMDDKQSETFMKILKDNISNMGYTNRNEMFEAFYYMVNDVLKGYYTKPEIIYGDTDSIFFRMNIIDVETKVKLKDMQGIKDKKELMMCITIGIWTSNMIKTMLPPPMQQEYEKTLYPFVIQGKKRYVGNLYEKTPNNFYQKSMGIELKRRDNAPIVKNVCAGIIDQILNKHSSEGAYKFTKETLHNIVTGKYKMDKFIISKTLKGNSLSKAERRLEQAKPKEQRSYANRESIVHAVLADRQAERSYGDRPMSNDRIQYIYIETKTEPKLQGDRVESPEYIIEHKLKIDYLFYITNQIMKPALKFLDLIINNAENVFQEYIIKEENRKQCMMPIAYYANKDGDDNDSDDVTKDYINFDDLPQVSRSTNSDKKKKTIKKSTPKSHKKKALVTTDTVNLFNLMNNDVNSDNSRSESDSKKKTAKKPTKKKSSNCDKKSIIKSEKLCVSTNDLFN